MRFNQEHKNKRTSKKLFINLKNNHTYKYHAFISYAHEDKETVRWLYHLLVNYWVPWKRRRRVFLDTETVPADGGLTSTIKQALENSRYLIVCCSKSAVESPWVHLEIEEFIKTHSAHNVLACMVGAENEYELHDSVQKIESQLNDSLLKPDLRGNIAQLEKSELNQKKEDALALLASILSLRDKYEVLNRVYRVKQTILASSLSFVVLSSSLYIGWQEWLKTPPGLRNIAIKKVLISATSETIDDHRLILTAQALGKGGRKKDLEKFAQIFTNNPSNPFFKSLALAAGYASLPEPDCEMAETQLKKLDKSTAQSWPEAFLITEKSCGGNWSSIARPEVLEPDRMLNWGLALAKTGHIDAAQSLKTLPMFPANDKFTLEVFIGIAKKETISSNEDSINNWIKDNDCDDILRNSLDLLRELDKADLLKDETSEVLLDLGLLCVSKLDVEMVNYWNLFQELAARLAGADRDEDAFLLLKEGKDNNSNRTNDPYFAPGLAWRGLAYYRLEQKNEASESFDQAQLAGLSQPLMSRTWSEWDDIVLAYVMAGDWKGAFNASEKPRDERVRLFLRAKLIELWSVLYSK